jgi:DNA-binding CsgD family transcriptional regulator/PAS domain-containing protein
MSNSNQGALKLLECLHGAPGDGMTYLRFLGLLEQACSPGGLILHAAYAQEERPGLLIGPSIGLKEAGFSELMTEFEHPVVAEFPAGSILPIPAESAFYRSRFFDDVLAPAGASPGPGLVVLLERGATQVSSATVLLPGRPGWAPTREDRALLEQLAPHMVIARRLHLRVAVRQREGQALVSAFDRLVLGVVFTDEAGRISYANRSAAELIGHPPGFSEQGAILDDHTRAWCDLLAREPGRGALIRAPDDGRPIQVLQAPLGWQTNEPLAASRFAHAYFIADPKQSTGDPIQVLGEMFGLTESETRLATLLMADTSLKDAARLLGITHSTARGVLKNIFAKTGTGRQSELMGLLVRGPIGQLRTRSAERSSRPSKPNPRAGRPVRRRVPG